MWKINVWLLTSAILFALCDSAAILSKFEKCPFADSACKAKWFKGFLGEVADNGIPELDIPKVDPYELKGDYIELLGMIKITMLEGKASGLKQCQTTIFEHDVKNLRVIMESVCDTFTIDGKYKIEPTAAFKALAGDINVHGEGHGILTLKKLKFNFESPFEIVKGSDGEKHIKVLADEATYSSDVLEKATLSAENIFLGSQDISAAVTNIFNENWKSLTKNFGNTVLEKAVTIIVNTVSKFVDTVPAKEFISDI